MSQLISLAKAIEMTTLHRREKENILDAAAKNQGTLPKCETFSRDVFDAILAQAGCDGIRIYYGMDELMKVHALIVGVNVNDEDIVDRESLNSLIIENSRRCPDDCPPASPLNE